MTEEILHTMCVCVCVFLKNIIATVFFDKLIYSGDVERQIQFFFTSFINDRKL